MDFFGMLFSVPQYIDVEDKIAGPLTGRQLLWLFGLGAVAFVLYTILPRSVFFVALVPLIILFLALAFYRPQGLPFYRFLINITMFMFRPKIYVWKRSTEAKAREKQAKKDLPKKKAPPKTMTSEDLAKLARVLDTEGMERSKKILEIVKKRQRPEEVQPEREKDQKRSVLSVLRTDRSEKGKESKKKFVALQKEKSKGRIIYMK